ncbi:MAG: ATP-dependent nuclease [Dissulfurispiraceae bacterium]
MIEEITIKFSSKGTADILAIPIGAITIFLGPNNSGKSVALKEIESWCRAGPIGNTLIISDIKFRLPRDDELEEELEQLRLNPQQGQYIPEDHILFGKVNTDRSGFTQFLVQKHYLFQWKNQVPTQAGFFTHFISLFTVRLDGRSRFTLTDPQQSGDLTAPSQNHLVELMKSDVKRFEIRRIIQDAFGKCFVIDPTGMQQLKIRFSDREPVDNYEEQALDERAREFHTNATEIAALSDGVKAFTGCVAAVLAGDSKIILIDEPEAFLHPVLTFKLGKELSNLARNKKGNLIVATHSSHFLMGCIQSGAPINIIRLTYSNNVPTARLLASNTLSSLMKSPMLRSTGILESLFYESVVICEGDSDRAFYQEVNERLLNSGSPGISNTLFANAQNKQTVADIIKPLREIGIPAAGILDIDIIKDDGSVWSKLLSSAQVPGTLQGSLLDLRNRLRAKFGTSGKDMKRDGGINVLSASDKESCESLFNQLSEYGIFVVPCGEVESWLKNLGASGRKSDWLIDMFEKMKEDPEDKDYVRPTDGDVWLFLRSIAAWINNPAKKGILK